MNGKTTISQRWLSTMSHFKNHVSPSLTPTIKQWLNRTLEPGSQGAVSGHVKSVRQMKSIQFVDISDGSSPNLLLVVIKKNADDPKLDLRVGQSIHVNGQWALSKGNEQTIELKCTTTDPSSISVIGDVPDSYPMQKKSHSLQFLRTQPTLRHRTNLLSSVLRFRSFVESRFIEYYEEKGFCKVSPPIITSSDCEGAGDMFKIEAPPKGHSEIHHKQGFFGRPTFLTVSTQLHLEVLALSLNRVWTLTPCFRAENSNTNRHLSEFWMLEAEICYVDDVSQLTDFCEDMIRSVTEKIVSSNAATDIMSSRFDKEEVEAMQNRWATILSDKKWPSITYNDACELINLVMYKDEPQNRLSWGESIQTVHEKWLAGEYFRSPIFITDYPVGEKPFYMPKSKNFDREKPTVACFDLIFPEIGELIGGSLREHRYDELVAAMTSRGMNVNDMQWYLSTRENGSVPHGGFGMGFERLIAYLGAVENIKDIIPFPRSPLTCDC
ncbi:asparaginyl-tRNA synthetase [Scheffersomyces spartinae]|uniref:asparagine--tRNA ligase n=1 Tax=Scheffersomyces spartinae TaxID=45513 RepID=A0A9P8AJ44_9ASCO|nr:asparaginyl-tRNA synthetase [Scheffersomyces spartinae]KAG7194474.1 asparaginyl-tRNA synthetase [Scheffersomyces spartinae]